MAIQRHPIFGLTQGAPANKAAASVRDHTGLSHSSSVSFVDPIARVPGLRCYERMNVGV